MTELPILTADSGWLIIWNDIKTFGAGFWSFFFLISFYVLKDQIKELVKLLINKLTFKSTHKLKYVKKDLSNHSIFKNLDYWLNIGIKAIRLKSNLHPEEEDYINNKEKMAKEVIRILYETMRESLKTFIDEYDIDNLDCEVTRNYLMNCLTKNSITMKRKFVERGISLKFLNKFYALSDLADNIIFASVKNVFIKDSELTTSTKTYLAFNLLESYLSITFNNLLETIDLINGDLKDELFDGMPMCKSYRSVLKAPHPTYTMIVKEKLNEILRDFNGSRAYVCKYFIKEGEHFHSAIYESTIKGVTSEMNNIQMVCDDLEKSIINIMKESGCIAADIAKFGANTIERFNARGVKGILLCPIYNNNEIDGCLCVDYISYEKFENAVKDKDLDKKLKDYASSLSPYIIYPKNYSY